jgi:hypothetical protein
VGVIALLWAPALVAQANTSSWPVHSMDRPRPPVVAPGPERPPAPPPEDAIVLLGNSGLGAWGADSASPAEWSYAQGVATVAPGKGSMQTRKAFGSVQLHLEFATVNPPLGEGQDRSNSGVFLMGRYEVQILDSYNSETYADGQAGAVYGQYPPLVNAARPPGQWQSYDIVFIRPIFRPDGSVERPARITVLFNGVLVQNDVTLIGQTAHGRVATYEAHADKLPLALQDHGHKVRFRNIWIRELDD